MTHTCITTSQIAAVDADPYLDTGEISKAALLDALRCPLTCHPSDKSRVSQIIADIKSSGNLVYLPTEKSAQDFLHAVSLGDYFNVPFKAKAAYCRAYINMRNAAAGSGARSPWKQKRPASEAFDYDQLANKVAAVISKNDKPQPQPQPRPQPSGIAANFFDAPGPPNDVFKDGFNNRLNEGIHPTRLPYNNAGSYGSTGTR